MHVAIDSLHFCRSEESAGRGEEEKRIRSETLTCAVKKQKMAETVDLISPNELRLLFCSQRCFSCAVVKKHQYVQGKRILQSLLEVANLLVGRKTGGDIPRCNEICSSTKVSQIVD
ncbi:conserved hypothetical protein [Trichinella spiralis]|uniref:hypothetical protein n=1 Tax=Trichinella spiralis TaxID=6334 RepID=UPI0001EFC745|nr:conserved hypothetical protein [Trichinella spiralis]